MLSRKSRERDATSNVHLGFEGASEIQTRSLPRAVDFLWDPVGVVFAVIKTG
jgi:hypothetical protein